MKYIISIGIIVIGLCVLQIAQGQGTVYMSNLGQPSAGSFAVGSDSWQGVLFATGNNPNGYMLNSIDLGMTDVTGNPSGFMVMLYGNGNIPSGSYFGNSICTLSGSLNPATAGTYTFTPTSSITLSKQTDYSIVLIAGTTIANGAYEWSYASTYSYNLNGAWGSGGGLWTSSNNGSSWNGPITGNLQYAITATAIPEPSAMSLVFLGSGILFYVRRKK